MVVRALAVPVRSLGVRVDQGDDLGVRVLVQVWQVPARGTKIAT